MGVLGCGRIRTAGCRWPGPAAACAVREVWARHESRYRREDLAECVQDIGSPGGNSKPLPGSLKALAAGGPARRPIEGAEPLTESGGVDRETSRREGPPTATRKGALTGSSPGRGCPCPVAERLLRPSEACARSDPPALTAHGSACRLRRFSEHGQPLLAALGGGRAAKEARGSGHQAPSSQTA